MPAVSHRRLVAHFTRVDPVMASLAREIGPCGLRRVELDSPFRHLVEAIIAQQISGKAAASIQQRLLAALGTRGGKFPTAKRILATPIDILRGAGLSRAKAMAVQDLAAKSEAGIVPNVRTLDALEDALIIERLTQIRGIGPWTVQMMLMFQLGRPDVLPVTDFGVRSGFRLAYRKRQLPTPGQLARFGVRWAPYRSAAAWYLWRATERVAD
jgi:DNA-3-methyladenine glycosylase II